MLSFPDDVLTQQHRQTLVALTQHLGLSEAQQCDCNSACQTVSDEMTGDMGGPKKRRRGTPRHPWRPIIQMRSLCLPERYRVHLEANGTDPLCFINDNEVLQNAVVDYGESDVGDAFMACYNYALQLVRRRATDRIRWFFTMIMFFDLVRLIRPHGSGRVGRLMMQEIVGFLGPLIDAGEIEAEVTLAQINEWQLCGSKLDHLCRKFGPGSLFYLEDQLSPDL